MKFLFILLTTALIISRAALSFHLRDSAPPHPSDTPQDYLESYYKNKEDYITAYAAHPAIPLVPVRAMITSHHFLARDYIAETFAGIDPTPLRTVIIVSPDHFHRITDPALAQTTDTPWATLDGVLSADTGLIATLTGTPTVGKDLRLFRAEHGIYTLIPFTKISFPNTRVVPLVLRQSTDYAYYYDLGTTLAASTDPTTTLLVVSSDFTHKADVQTAAARDRKSIDLLPTLNLADTAGITNDCRQCIALLFGYLHGQNVTFHLVFNTTSYSISGENPADVTSYVGAYYLPR